MAKLNTILVTGAVALALAGCAHKRKDVPPPPVDNSQPVDQTPVGPPTGADTAAGGLDADFRRSVTSNTVNFGVDMFDIDPTARTILDSQAAWLARNPAARATIEGHCDERGTREYNLALGDKRANAAKNYLVAKGIDPARLTTISYGKERPVATGSDEQSWAQNRRAVTVVVG